MTISLKHAFQSAKADGADSSLVRPSNWNAEHTLTMATARLLGRSTAGTGVAEEISLGTGLSFSGTQLQVNATTALGFTPVQQGGGTGQSTNKVYIGWAVSGSVLLLQVDSTNFGDTWPIQISGQAASARYLKQGAASGGTNMQFNWSGQGGQPNWLWGGNDGVNHNVYNPSNFNVNYANGAGNADTLDGLNSSVFAQFHTGGGAADTNLPIGSVVFAYSNGAYVLNQVVAVYINTASTSYYTLNTSAGAQLSGTWRNRGSIPYSGGNCVCVIQRTA